MHISNKCYKTVFKKFHLILKEASTHEFQNQIKICRLFCFKMGYANPSQVTGGIHIRQFSRAYIIADVNKPEDRVVFVSIDAGMQDQLVTLEVRNYDCSKY